MPWTREGGWRDPWLPLTDTSRNVEDQRADPGSTLCFARDLIALRRRVVDLRSGRYEELAAPDGTWAWRRGDGVVVAVNLGSEAIVLEGVEGSIAIATNRDRDGEPIPGGLELAGAEGAIVVSRR